MVRYKVHSENPNARSLEKARQVLADGGLIIYPTDSVYGIGCNLYEKNAIQRLYRLKEKSKFDPVSIIVKDIRQASMYARISNYAYRIMRHCLPGPYTFILPATKEIPKVMLSKRKEVGIRVPENKVCSHLLDIFQNPIVNTSVNIDENELLNDPEEILEKYQNFVDLMLDAEWLPEAEESTVCSLVTDEVLILREGKGEVSKLYEK